MKQILIIITLCVGGLIAGLKGFTTDSAIFVSVALALIYFTNHEN